MKNDDDIIDGDDALLNEAMQDTQVKEAVQKMVRQRTLELVDYKSNQPILREEMRLIGDEGDRAIAKSAEMLSQNKEGKRLEEKLDKAGLRVNAQAFEEVKHEINEFIRKNSLKK